MSSPRPSLPPISHVACRINSPPPPSILLFTTKPKHPNQNRRSDKRIEITRKNILPYLPVRQSPRRVRLEDKHPPSSSPPPYCSLLNPKITQSAHPTPPREKEKNYPSPHLLPLVGDEGVEVGWSGVGGGEKKSSTSAPADVLICLQKKTTSFHLPLLLIKLNPLNQKRTNPNNQLKK